MSGWQALFYKEILRFWQVSFQTVAAPVLAAAAWQGNPPALVLGWLALMVVVTTFVTPPVLRALLAKRQIPDEVPPVAELVTEAPMEDE